MPELCPVKSGPPQWPGVGRVDRTAGTLAVDLRVMGKGAFAGLRQKSAKRQQGLLALLQKLSKGKALEQDLGACA